MFEPEEPVRNDERGAILLIALFFSVFMVGMVYYVFGVAEAVLSSERMQDAVDASALSGAVMQARAMNFIVLINIVMSALLAILVALKLVETLAMLGIIIATAFAPPTFGATLVFVPPLEFVRNTTSLMYGNLQTPIYQALEGLNVVATTVATTAPGFAQALATEDVKEHWSPPVDLAVVVASRQDSLPVENDQFEVLCEKAGNVVGSIAGAPFAGLGKVQEEIEKALGAAAHQFSSWFCGGSSGSSSSEPPPIGRTIEHQYPTLPSSEECTRTNNESVCADANEEQNDAEPDDVTGECQSGHDCALGGPYETNLVAARTDCAPTLEPPPVEYWYQEQTGTVSYVWNGLIWERGDTELDPPAKKHLLSEIWPHTPPCPPDNYSLTVHPNGDVNEINPVCSSGGEPPLPPFVRTPRGTVKKVPITRVLNILRCRRDIYENVRGEEGEPAERSGDERAPKKIESNIDLGDEDFQVRAFASRQGRMAGPGQAVRITLWGAQAPDPGLDTLNELGRYAVAQAEYFYDGAETDRQAWMWSMKWRARLRRFRVPEDGIVAGVLAGLYDGSGRFLGTLGGLGDLVMH